MLCYLGTCVDVSRLQVLICIMILHTLCEAISAMEPNNLFSSLSRAAFVLHLDVGELHFSLNFKHLTK